MGDSMYVVVDTNTGQWLTNPIPREDAYSLAYTGNRTVHVEEVED